MNSDVLLGNLTRREFRERMASGELLGCILPVAAVEQHLEHLALEHDWRSARTIAIQAAERLRPRVIVAEGLMAGISEHHMKHPGTLSLTPATFLAVLHDLVDSLCRAGFRNIVVLNGHGGNIAPCRAVWDQFLRRFQCNLHFVSYWDLLPREEVLPHLQTGDFPGHAQEFETAIALAAFPENVRADALHDQSDPAPALATEANGRALLALAVERVALFVDDVVHERRRQETPPFFP
jgi:creatinine amidohydrolase